MLKKTVFLYTALNLCIPAHACTGIFLKTINRCYVYARTLEFGQDLQSQALFMPHNYTCKALAPSGNAQGLVWKTKYAALGANAFGSTDFIDGVNEQGLAGGLFYFPGFAEYQEVPPQNYAQSLPMWQLLTWILTTCATTDEVKNTLPTIYISKTPFPALKGVVPAHLVVHDAAGKSIVIEYIKGKLAIHDNPLGVITNAPNFDWHMTNISNYLNLSPLSAKKKSLSGITFKPLGQGSGMLGLPGDFTPPSRFIRAVAFTQAAPPAATEADAIHQAFHILNNFDIPKNIAIDQNYAADYTQWTSAIDMKNKIFYFRTYEHFQIRKLELTKMNFTTPKIFDATRLHSFASVK